MITKGDIDRLGDRIRLEGSTLKDDTLEQLQEYRISYKDSLATIFNILCTTTKQINVSSIVTYRLKRFESIIGKLHRKPSMKFNRMWDIAGCRCILTRDSHLYKMKELISKRLTIRKEYDYLITPPEDGYRALHLFVSLPDDDKIVEVQLRSQNDHNWATLVEITDLLYDTKLKEYGDHKQLAKFHFLLSKKDQLSNIEKLEIADLIKQYKYVEKLSDVFSRNYIEVRQQWLDIETKPKHKYFLIKANKKDVPQIQSFSSFLDAERKYFEVYKTSPSANVVLTHLPKPSYHQVSIAYSNYILTFHSFLDDCYNILEDAIVESLDKGDMRKFLKYYNLYVTVVYNQIKNLTSEIQEVRNRFRKSSSKIKPNRKEKEWILDIEDQIKKRRISQRHLQHSISSHTPTGSVNKFIYFQILNLVSRKYKWRFKKVFRNVGIK